MRRYLEDTPNHTFWFPSLGIPPLSTPYNHPKRTDNPLYNNVRFFYFVVFRVGVSRHILHLSFKKLYFITLPTTPSQNRILSLQIQKSVTPNCHTKCHPKGTIVTLGHKKKETISLPYKNNCRMVIFFRSNAILIYSPTLPSYSLK